MSGDHPEPVRGVDVHVRTGVDAGAHEGGLRRSRAGEARRRRTRGLSAQARQQRHADDRRPRLQQARVGGPSRRHPTRVHLCCLHGTFTYLRSDNYFTTPCSRKLHLCL